MKIHLQRLAEYAQSETYISYDKLDGWPREQLEEQGYLKEAVRQAVIICDQCSERCPIPRDRVIRREDDKSMGLLPCENNPDVSFVDVNLDRYKQYRIITRKLQAEGYLADIGNTNSSGESPETESKSKEHVTVDLCDFQKQTGGHMNLLKDIEVVLPGKRIPLDTQRHKTDAVKTLQRALKAKGHGILAGKIHKENNNAYCDVRIKFDY